MKKSIILLLALFLFLIQPSISTSSISLDIANQEIDSFSLDSYTNILKSGVYRIGKDTGIFKPGEYKFGLISQSSKCYLFVIDKDTVLRYSKRFDSTKGQENNSVFSVGTFLEGDSMIIFGDGEFYFTPIEV